MRYLLSCFLALCFAGHSFAQSDLPINTAVKVPINVAPITDDTGAIDSGLVYDEPGLLLVWVFTTSAGETTETAVTPTDTGGLHDWTDLGITYKIEIPASGGTINNDTAGTGYFMGDCTATLPWRGPLVRFYVKTAIAFMGGVPQEMVIPASGNNAYAFNITLVDGSNTKVSATTGPTLTLVDEANTNLVAWLTTATPSASSTGVYPVTITVPNTATAKTLTLGISGSVTGYSGFSDSASIHVAKSAYDKLTAANTLPGQGNPSATASMEDMVRYLYKAWLNPSTVTDNGDGTSTYRLKSNDGTTVDQKSTNSDDGTTYTKGKTVTGP